MNYTNIAVINIDPSVDIQKYIISKLGGRDAVVFRKEGETYELPAGTTNIVIIPADHDNQAKIKNFVNRWFAQNKKIGFLHVIEDHTEVLKDPTEYIEKIERMMDLFDIPIYFSCATDPCNYVYKKYNPRMAIDIDTEEFKHFGLSKLCFTSHSNTAWTIYNLDKVDFNVTKFDETFSIAMYYIIKFLSERRANAPGSLMLMNMYATIPEEVGVFRNNTELKPLPDSKVEDLQREDALFKEMKVDNRPDNNIDEVLTRVYLKLLEKSK